MGLDELGQVRVDLGHDRLVGDLPGQGPQLGPVLAGDEGQGGVLGARGRAPARKIRPLPGEAEQVGPAVEVAALEALGQQVQAGAGDEGVEAEEGGPRLSGRLRWRRLRFGRADGVVHAGRFLPERCGTAGGTRLAPVSGAGGLPVLSGSGRTLAAASPLCDSFHKPARRCSTAVHTDHGVGRRAPFGVRPAAQHPRVWPPARTSTRTSNERPAGPANRTSTTPCGSGPVARSPPGRRRRAALPGPGGSARRPGPRTAPPPGPGSCPGRRCRPRRRRPRGRRPPATAARSTGRGAGRPGCRRSGRPP